MPDEPIEQKYRDMMNGLAHALNKVLAPAGFALFVFDFKDNSKVNYISNAKREDMVAAMKEWIKRQP